MLACYACIYSTFINRINRTTYPYANMHSQQQSPPRDGDIQGCCDPLLDTAFYCYHCGRSLPHEPVLLLKCVSAIMCSCLLVLWVLVARFLSQLDLWPLVEGGHHVHSMDQITVSPAPNTQPASGPSHVSVLVCKCSFCMSIVWYSFALFGRNTFMTCVWLVKTLEIRVFHLRNHALQCTYPLQPPISL